MLYEGFPLPVTVLPGEESCLVVHRGVQGPHLDDRHCWCLPTCFTQDEVDSLTIEQFNAALRSGVQ